MTLREFLEIPNNQYINSMLKWESQFLLFQNDNIDLVLRPDHLEKSNKDIIEIVVEARVVLNIIKMKVMVLEKKEKRIVMADMTKD
jgi:hypothetical protein